MNEEVKQLVDALLHEDNCNVLDYIDDAADLIENLSAENERLKARCEAAENDIEAMIHEQGGNLDLCHWCAGNCASGEYLCDTNGAWRGPRDGGNEDEQD